MGAGGRGRTGPSTARETNCRGCMGWACSPGRVGVGVTSPGLPNADGATPPPFVVPHPLSFPGGGGGPSLGQPNIFRCGSLCCCVGDCVVGHCHLYPLHSWWGILLTLAEMELDSTTMFPPGTGQM